jgi:hypothetical protein
LAKPPKLTPTCQTAISRHWRSWSRPQKVS